LEKIRDQQTRTESKTRLVEQIKICLHSGDYSRALDLLRGTAAEFPNDNDAELSELEKLADDGVKRNAEAQRLITESQELFARRKSAEAIQLLRKAYELDKNNSLARSILANALVEHAHSMVETDWLKAETLTNQALSLNPAHPTAKTILGLIVTKKETSSMEDWVSQARKLQSSGDLFAALAWVAEGLAVHPHDPKLLQIQDEIQRDQDARRRQARRGDLDDLRRLQREIDGATDVAAKQALAVRIQALAAKHWTDGEILSIANALLLRLGLISQESSSVSPRSKGGTVILRVPRLSAPKASPDSSQIPPSQVASSEVPASPVLSTQVTIKEVAPPILPMPVEAKEVAPSAVLPAQSAQSPVPPSAVPASAPPNPIAPGNVPTGIAPPKVTPSKVTPSKVPLRRAPRGRVLTTPPETRFPAPLFATVPAAEPSGPAAKVASASAQPRQAARSNSTTLILVSAAAIVLVAVAATFFFARRHPAPPVANIPSAAPTVSAPAISAPAASTPTPATPEPSVPALGVSSDTAPGKVTVNDRPEYDQPTAEQPTAESGHDLGTLLVVAGQDDARVFLNGKLQRQHTRAGQLRLPNLEPNDYVVQVSKSGFQDPPQQKIRIRKGEPARLVFSLQPQPRLASLTIQGGAPGTAVLVDQTFAGTIQPDGTLSVSNVNPGDHTVELRKDRFKPRQLKKHFVVGGTVSLAASDAALEAAPESALGELKITFAPADATVAIVKGDLLKMVSSGVPLNLAAGTYTLTARTAERFTRTSALEVVAGQSRTLDLSLAPTGMSKWDDPGAWKHEGNSFIRKGGDFVFYGVVPSSGTFVFSAMPAKGRLLQWVLNYSDPKNYVLFQMDENNFYRTVIHNGQKSDQIIVPDKGDKKSFRTLQIRVSPTELVHQIKHGDSWRILDRWTQPGANLSAGKFAFYIPGNDEVALSSFAHYAELNIR
jgi:tetratricopeptide (TPR) repeat protein